jgi:hypothetical protein
LENATDNFRMSNEVFLDLHDVLVQRYGLQPFIHMDTYEMLAMFLYTCGGNESKAPFGSHK